MGLWIKKEDQMSFMKYDLDKIVEKNHPLRKICGIINFKAIALDFKGVINELGRKGYGVELGIRGLFLQFYYDLSDRELEERLRYDIALRWFCGLSIDDDSPDHTYFFRIRKTFGIERIAKILVKINRQAKKKGLLEKVFSFIDTSAIKAKETTWEERDKAIKEGEEQILVWI